MTYDIRPEDELTTNALQDIHDDLEELNGHIRAYLETMAVTLLAPCGPDSTEAAAKAREAAALKLLGHATKEAECE